MARVNLFGGRIEREDLTVNSSFTNAASDQLSVLSPEVQYDDGFVSRLPQKKENPRDDLYVQCSRSCMKREL